jgi:hypothetical protein
VSTYLVSKTSIGVGSWKALKGLLEKSLYGCEMSSGLVVTLLTLLAVWPERELVKVYMSVGVQEHVCVLKHVAHRYAHMQVHVCACVNRCA